MAVSDKPPKSHERSPASIHARPNPGYEYSPPKAVRLRHCRTGQWIIAIEIDGGALCDMAFTHHHLGGNTPPKD